MTDNKNRVVITGLGMICAIGNNVEETWNNVLNSVSGIKPTTSVDTKDCYSVVAAEVSCDTLDEVKNADSMDRVSKLCVKAAGEAICDSKLDMTKEDADRVSVIMGSCVGGVNSIEHYYQNEKPASDVSKMTISAIANQVAYAYNAGGVVTNIANACAAGTMSIAYASDLIRAGKTDVVIAGGSDAFASVPYAGFLALHALDPEGCAPFNRLGGITLGEGSGALIVESYEHAIARGAHIYCEVLGSGISSDAHHITSPRDDGEGQMNCINWGLEASGIDPSVVGYVNAHGTGTSKNDMSEFLSIHTIFDGKNDNVSVSSTKAMTGHCLGAAGSIEAIMAIKALTTNTVPPTLGYKEEDMATLAERAGKLDFVANKPHEKELNYVMNNSFAFGGNNASIIFSKEQGDVKVVEDKPEAVVTGFGLVTALGNGLDNFIEKYNESAVPEKPSMESAVALENFNGVGLKMAFYRKLDKFAQINAVSGVAALQNAGVVISDENATGIGISVGTAAGPISTIAKFQQDLVAGGNVAGSAFKFPNTVYNAAGGYLSICSGIKGYNVTVTNGTQSGVANLAYGLEVIRNKKANVILANGTDENSDVIEEFYTKLGTLASDVHGLYTNGKGYTLSDGSVTLVMENADEAAKRNAKVYAKVKGYGMAHGAVAFESVPSETAMIKAVNKAIADAGLSIADIDGVVGFANGDATVDAVETAGLKAVFGDCFTSLPVFTVKDIFGEGRAATATLSAVLASLMVSGKYDLDGHCYKYDGEKMAVAKADTKAMKNMVVVSYGIGGSFSAVVIGK